MATQVPDNHDKAHEEMTEEDAIERGRDLAAQNHEAEQEHLEESKVDTGTGTAVEEGKVPENNETNGFGAHDKTTETDKAGNPTKGGPRSSSSKK